jgi:CHAD domain-containing protein
LLEQPVGELRLQILADETPQPFTLYDTFDHAVAECYVALIESGARLHLLGRDGHLLTQKAARSGDFVADLAEGPVREALGFVSPLRSLLPLAKGRARRVALSCVDGEGRVRLHMVVQLLTRGDGGVALVSLAGLRGEGKALERTRKAIGTLGGAPLEAGAVYARLLPEVTPYVSRPKLPLSPRDHAQKTANKIIAAHLDLMQRNVPGILADSDTEFLHHYRVALRKIRSALSLFKGVYTDAQTAELKTRFAALMAQTSRMRDLDVHLLDRQRLYESLPEAVHGGLDGLFALYSAARETELDRLRQHLRSPAYGAEIAALERLFAAAAKGKGKGKHRALPLGPKGRARIGGYAAKLIWKRYKTICRIGAALSETTPDEEIHALRIQCKKLRYLMEFFQPLYPASEMQPLVETLKRLQETLGDFNDSAVQQESLRDVLARLDETAPDALQIAQAVGALTTLLHRRQMAARRGDGALCRLRQPAGAAHLPQVVPRRARLTLGAAERPGYPDRG